MSALERFFVQTSMLPPVPKVVSELLDKLDDPNADIHTIAQSLSRDQVLVAKVLRMANSSYYGVSGTIGNVDDAIKMLGLIQVQIIVITCGVSGAFAKVKGLQLGQFWRSSLLAGMIARFLAVETRENPGFAFTAGLMHSIGQLLIHAGFPEVGAELERSSAQHNLLERRDAEKEILGVDHQEIGAELARRWNFPLPIQRAIRFYLDPDSTEAAPLSRLVFIAAMIAQSLEQGADITQAIAALPPASVRGLDLDEEKLTGHIEHFSSLVADVASIV